MGKNFKDFIKAYRIQIVSGFITVMGAIVFFYDEFKEYRDLGVGFWGKLLDLKTLVGAVFFLFISALAVYLVLWILAQLLQRLPLHPKVRTARHEGQHEFSNHLNRAIKVARPGKFFSPNRWQWNKLTAAAIQGLMDKNVIELHCEQGRKEFPVIFCNFQGYAHSVSSVLDLIRELNCEKPYPQVWTILKRPIWNWYIPFPVDWIDNGNTYSGNITFPWWENYKSTIREMKGAEEPIKLYRLVAHILSQTTIEDAKDYFLFDTNALTIPKAKELAEQYDYIEWHPDIHHIINSTFNYQSLPKELQPHIYLIGKYADEDMDKTQGTRLIDHFHESFHDHSEDPSPGDGGVFIRYLDSLPERLRHYDDIFIVRLSETSGFGMVFIDDESRDVNGMRFLPEYELKEEGDPPGLLPLVKEAWTTGKPDFCICREE
ncbi:MAG: hypothetical protein E3J72_12305 [Planctomycetota bacterium]|nr:MAG: hypothetical protein E3J72_12305 [Planctomycetota bacterium]